MYDDAVDTGQRSTVDGGPDMIQLLTPQGELRNPDELGEDPILQDAARVAGEIDAEMLRGWYRDMVLVRRMDNEATNLQRHGELGLWASLLGQEAAQIGSGRALRKQDFAFPTYREHGVAWCRGVDPIHSLRMFRGTTLGAWDPHEYNFHLYTIVIGSQALHATGYAMGVQRDGKVGNNDTDRDEAVIAYFGDGASAQGDVNEALVFAGVNNAPMVFFCQNNQWAISEPNHRQIRGSLYKRAQGFGMPGLRVDGNDVIATYCVTRALLDRARAGEGPAMVEAFTYRMAPHTTTDDATRYRDDAEVDVWRDRDPIMRLRKNLEANGFGDEAFFKSVDEEAEEQGAALRQTLGRVEDPEPISMFDNLYNEPHALNAEERAEFEAYHASFLDEKTSSH